MTDSDGIKNLKLLHRAIATMKALKKGPLDAVAHQHLVDWLDEAIVELSGTASDGTRSLNAGVLSEPPSTLSESAGAWRSAPSRLYSELWNVYCGNQKIVGCISESEAAYLVEDHNTPAAPVQAEPVAWKDAKALIMRLREGAKSYAKATQMMADDKTARNRAAEGIPNDGPGYMGLAPEQTDQWKAADLIERFYASPPTPVSAGLDDVGKQNGSEKL